MIINNDDMLTTIAHIIKEQRNELKLTVKELSERSGVSVGVISDLENNRGRVPSLINFINLAKALKLPDDMFTSLIQGNIEKSSKNKTQLREDLKDAMLCYGLNENNAEMFITQIDSIISTQCSAKRTRNRNFNNNQSQK